MGCPNGWLDYRPVGRVIPGTRIIAFKTPLKSEIHSATSSDPTHDRFTPDDCVKAVRRCSHDRHRLGLVLNLTFTTKYYNPHDFERVRVHYGAIKCPGQVIPSDELFFQFQRSLYDFFYDYPDRNILVGVHCTHGVNRTGYMIARFLIQCEGWSVEEAITTVGESRGYPIERENYLSHLNNLHKPSHLFPKVVLDRDGSNSHNQGAKNEGSNKKLKRDHKEISDDLIKDRESERNSKKQNSAPDSTQNERESETEPSDGFIALS